MTESTTSALDGSPDFPNWSRVESAPIGHPQIEGYTLVLTPPLPPYLSGGFGRVYRAMNRDGVLKAVKVPDPERLGPSSATRWEDECRMSLALPPHEHVVTFFERTTARWPGGATSAALVMEWLEGARPLIPYAEAVGLDKPQRVALFRQALEGAAWLHAHGTPHCDLKSGNLLVIERGRRALVKITDFGGTRGGISHEAHGGGRNDPRPPIYSPHRAAPEVLAGDPAAIDARADVYSLGMELAGLVGDPPVLRDPALESVIARATAIERAHRFADAGEMLEALERYAPPRRERWSRRLERLLWPPERHDRRWLRPVAVLPAIMLAAAVVSLLLLHSVIISNVAPLPRVAAPTVRSLPHVAILRAMDDDETGRIARLAGIEGVTSEIPTRRRVWARVVDTLVEAQPSAIVFDIIFRRGDPELDAVIADALRGAKAKGVPVVIGVDGSHPGPPHEHRTPNAVSEAVALAASGWGSTRIEHLHSVEMALVIPRGVAGDIRMPLSLAAAAQVLGDSPPTAPVFDESRGDLLFPGSSGRGRRIPLFAIAPADGAWGEAIDGVDPSDLLGIYPVEPSSDELLRSVEASVESLWSPDAATAARTRDLVRGRVVFIAAYSPADIHHWADGRDIPGVWLHAGATQAFLSSIPAPQVVWPARAIALAAVSLAALAGLGLLGWLLRRAGVAVPTFGGRWPASTLPARRAFARWKGFTAAVALAALLVPLAALMAANGFDWHTDYVTGALLVGLLVGAITGAVLALVASWLGLVRRAWCLDRARAPVQPMIR